MKKSLVRLVFLASAVFIGLAMFGPAKHHDEWLNVWLPPPVHAQQYATCFATGASPLSCGTASEGFVTIAAAAQAVTVQDAAVTATSRILLTYDYSVGGSSGVWAPTNVTCNTTPQLPFVTTRVVGASFTIGTAATFTTNPGCFSFRITSQ